jgi:phosphopantothenoylcysteine decarboxylase
VAPAMNTLMWEHPFTMEHLARLEQLTIEIIPPISKKLACGDIGFGALENPIKIAKTVIERVKQR